MPSPDALADEARGRLRREGFVPLRPDGRIAPLLEPGEALLDVCPNARLARTCAELDEAEAGVVYLTSRRLIHVATRAEAIELDCIREALVVGESLLLDLGGGAAVRIAVAQPGLLRVKTAAARAARRHGRGVRWRPVGPG